MNLLEELDRLLELYGTFTRPDGSGIRGHGVFRPLTVRAGNFPYDEDNPDQKYGEPGEVMGRGAKGAGPSHLPLTPFGTSWDGGPDEPVPDDFNGDDLEEGKVVDKYVFQDIPIHVENPVGSVRSWYDPHNDEEGETEMQYDYGFIPGTDGADDEEVDVYVGPDDGAEHAFVVHQMKAPDFDDYDEDKVMLGFPDAAAARDAYLDHYNDEQFFGGMEAIPLDDFRDEIIGEASGTPYFLAKAYQGADVGNATGIPGGGGGWANRPMKAWDEDEDAEERLDRYGEGLSIGASGYVPDGRGPDPDGDPKELGRKPPAGDVPWSVGDMPVDFSQAYGGSMRPSRGRYGLIPKESAWDVAESHLRNSPKP